MREGEPATDDEADAVGFVSGRVGGGDVLASDFVVGEDVGRVLLFGEVGGDEIIISNNDLTQLKL